MQFKQAINYMHFLIIIFILFLCHSFDQKTKIYFYFIFLILLLILCTEDYVWAHTNWCAWSLDVKNSLYQPQTSEFSFSNIKLYDNVTSNHTQNRVLPYTDSCTKLKTKNIFASGFKIWRIISNGNDSSVFEAWNKNVFSVVESFFSRWQILQVNILLTRAA